MLKGKTALVTGSTSGIGLGIAQALAAQGANIIVNGFGDVDGAKAEIAKSGSGIQVGYHGADMSKAAEIEDMMRYAEKDFGGVDILVNNAGIQFVAKIEEFPVDRWDAIIAINIASTHGLVASAEKSAYVAAKHGIVGFTKVTALETAQTGVTANAICPGWVLTPLVQKQVEARAQKEGIPVEQAKRELVIEKQPSGQFVTPEELGALAVFLSSEAARQVRGAIWNMDGGWVAQ